MNHVCVLSHSVVSTSLRSIDCRLPGSSVHGILQARILEWVAMPSSRSSSQPRDQTQVSCIAGRFFTVWATREAQESNILGNIYSDSENGLFHFSQSGECVIVFHVVWICISLMANGVENLSCAYWIFGWIAYFVSCLYNFILGFLSFSYWLLKGFLVKKRLFIWLLWLLVVAHGMF